LITDDTDVVVSEEGDDQLDDLIPEPEIAHMAEWWNTSTTVNPVVFERRVKVAQLWNRYGYSVKETADILGVDMHLVTSDRRWLISQWQRVVIADINEIIGQQLAKLEDTERELWVAWEKSKEDEITVTDQTVDDIDGTRTTRKTVTRGRLPEHRYMELILKVQERRSKLLGLDKIQDLGSTTFNFAVFVEQAYQKAIEKSGQVLDVTPLENRIESGK